MITNFAFVSLVSGTVIYYFASYIISSLQLYPYNPATFLLPFQHFEGISFGVIVLESAIILVTCAILFLKKEASKDVL